MKLDHLIQAYKMNNIDIQIEDMSNDNERVGVITFANGISASYLLDNEDIIVVMKIFFNCLTRETINIYTQLSHVISIINVMQQTIILVANIPQKECNMILDKLGLFDNTFKKRKENKIFRT